MDLGLDSPGRVLQVGVDLVVPISVCQLISGSDIMGDFLSVSLPAHSDPFGVEVVDAADQHGRMSASWWRHRVKSDGGFDWKTDVGHVRCELDLRVCGLIIQLKTAKNCFIFYFIS